MAARAAAIVVVAVVVGFALALPLSYDVNGISIKRNLPGRKVAR